MSDNTWSTVLAGPPQEVGQLGLPGAEPPGSPLSEPPARRRDLWVSLGIGVTGVSAAVSSFAGLRSLAAVTGWPDLMTPLFPLTLDAYAMTATRVWLVEGGRSRRTLRFARWNACGAIALSLTGNAAWHLIAAGLVSVTWPIVLFIGAVPPVVLGLVTHLAVLRGQSRTAEDVPVRAWIQPARPGPEPLAGPASAAPFRRRTEDDLLQAAREADATYRAAHGGRPITRDALRQVLRVGGPKTTALLRRIKEEASTGTSLPVEAANDPPAAAR